MVRAPKELGNTGTKQPHRTRMEPAPDKHDDGDDAPLLGGEDSDDEDIELPEDTVLAAVKEAGAGTLLLSALVAGYSVWYAGVAHPNYRKPRLALSNFPPQRQVHRHADQRSMRSAWTRATHFVDVSGAAMWAGDAAAAPPEPNVDELPEDGFSWADDDESPRRRTTTDELVFKHGHKVSGERGHLRLPRRFYEAATFGLTAHASTPYLYEETFNVTAAHESLGLALRNRTLDPPPSRVLPWRAALPHRADDADGWLVQYDLRDLTAWRENKRNHWWSAARKAQNRLDALQSGSLDHDWTEAKHAMEKLARQHDQLLIMSWMPAHFAAPHADDEFRHCHILQEIVPTRSGYQHLRESSVVWSI